MKLDSIITQGCNNLTACFSAEMDSETNTAFSGVGAWLVLATALIGANGKAKHELESALSINQDGAPNAISKLLEQFRASAGFALAAGFWHSPAIKIHSDYVSNIKPILVRLLPRDPGELDKWVNENTKGQISRFPPVVDEDTLFLVASVLSAAADWKAPFSTGIGGWREQGDWRYWLYRNDFETDNAALIQFNGITISRVICETVCGFDVHLLAGATDDEPGDILCAGIAALSGKGTVKNGSGLTEGDSGGCLMVRTEDTALPDKRLQISLPAFEIEARHELHDYPAVFGLSTAMDNSIGHFPLISETPLAVDKFVQVVKAEFGEKGFRASAASALSGLVAGIPETMKTLIIRVDHNRPFGFIVVDRASGLIPFVGWVADALKEPFKSRHLAKAKNVPISGC